MPGIVDVAIVVSNRPEYTKVCLDMLLEVDHGVAIRPIVVDNGSRNRTKTIISDWAERCRSSGGVGNRVAHPRVVTIEERMANGENMGFAFGLNRAIMESGPDRPFVMLHNDATPFAGCVAEMAWVLENGDEDAYVVVPRTNYANESTPCVADVRQRFQPLKPGTKDRLTPEEVRAIIGKTYPMGPDELTGPEGLLRKNLPRASYSPEVASFCMMVKPGAFERYGTFDEDFHPRGYEDKYWFQPIERSGGVCMVANWAYAHHWGNMSSDGPGYSFPDVMKANKERFDAKCLARDKAFFSRKPV